VIVDLVVVVVVVVDFSLSHSQRVIPSGARGLS